MGYIDNHNTPTLVAPAEAFEVPVEFTSKPPIERKHPRDIRVDCSSCIGACCLKGNIIPLTPLEAETLIASGTELSVGNGATRYRDGRQAYVLESDCGYLRTDLRTGKKFCSIYNDPNRPKECARVRTGSYACRAIRADQDAEPGERQRFELWLELSRAG